MIGVLVRRGADFPSAEDAVQSALEAALDAWRDAPPQDRQGWLVTVAWRRYLDQVRSETARRRREIRVTTQPPSGRASETDDSLRLYFLCAHPTLTQSSAVALTLRAVGGLTTAQIADAYQVPEATMAQRISRAKRAVAGVQFGESTGLTTVLRVLYLVFNEGYSGEVDLAGEAIRLTRQLTSLTQDPEASGLLALMLLHHARQPSRIDAAGQLVPLTEQDRSKWRTDLVAEGVELLQEALGQDQIGDYQAQAAIAALHADAPTVEETDWVQVREWYDELVAITASPVHRLNRVVAVAEADGPAAGLVALAELDQTQPRWHAVAAYLHTRRGDRAQACELYLQAARLATSTAERNHLHREALRLRRPGPESDCGHSP